MRNLAFLLATIGACGGADNGPADAIPTDASTDTPVDARAAGPVTYACSTGGAHCPVTDVVFQDAAGAVIAIETIGGDLLSATAIMAPGGYVTAIEPSMLLMYTFSDVQPGDVLYVHLGPGPFRPVSVTAPTVPGLNSYSLGHNCRDGIGGASADVASGTATVTLNDDYLDCDRADFIVGATDSPAGGGTNRSLVAIDVPVSPTVTLTGTYRAPIDSTLTITGLGPAFDAWAGLDLSGPHGLLTRDGATIDTAATTAQLTLPTVAPTPGLIAVAALAITDSATQGQGVVRRWGPHTGAATVDASHRHRRIDTSSYDAPTRTYRWTDVGPGASPDFFSAAIAWSIGGPTGTNVTWLFTAPAGSHAVALPPLPRVRDIDWSPPIAGVDISVGRPASYRITLDAPTPGQTHYDLGRPWVFVDLGSRTFGPAGELSIEM
ncbi:MAG: hypothetical protein JNK64_07895 [Myxococcales bacterium]|nr:hypothetical protein [Myxococcales bacterium]